MSAEQYLEKALPIIKQWHGPLKHHKLDTPLPANYHPKLDSSPFYKMIKSKCIKVTLAFFTGLLSLMHWFDIFCVTHGPFCCLSMKKQFSHVIQIFAYVKKHLWLKIIFDCSTHDWSLLNGSHMTGQNFIPIPMNPFWWICQRHGVCLYNSM